MVQDPYINKNFKDYLNSETRGTLDTCLKGVVLRKLCRFTRESLVIEEGYN